MATWQLRYCARKAQHAQHFRCSICDFSICSLWTCEPCYAAHHEGSATYRSSPVFAKMDEVQKLAKALPSFGTVQAIPVNCLKSGGSDGTRTRGLRRDRPKKQCIINPELERIRVLT